MLPNRIAVLLLLRWLAQCHGFLPSVVMMSKCPHRKVGKNLAANLDGDDQSNVEDIGDNSRRLAMQSMILAMTTCIPIRVSAGKPEIDASGQLFSPQAEMLRGGSDMTRGIRLAESARPMKLKPGETVQSVYETRFLAYLSRFLLNFDPAIHTWWVKQGFENSWEQLDFDESKAKERELVFAEFAESVEVGLSDYFVGPYGSYGSLEAAKAGLIASEQVTSKRAAKQSTWEKIMAGGKKKEPILSAIDDDMSKQGVLNLYTLLKARYTSKAAKRQLAILFSLIASPELQPKNEIRSLLGEADNATITKIDFSLLDKVQNEAESRTSSRRGGGYSINQPPRVIVDAPPALGDSYKTARIQPILKPTSRVLKINVLDGGEGYTEVPLVRVSQSGLLSNCEACAILDRNGHVESIVVLDPGYGYDKGSNAVPPKVSIEARPSKDSRGISSQFRAAKAEAELEYEVVGVDILEGGNGYVANDFPSLFIEPPAEDPDWYITKNIYKKPNLEDILKPESIELTVQEMRLGDGTLIDRSFTGNEVTKGIIIRLQRDPLELLPSMIRPELFDSFQGLVYRVPSLPIPPAKVGAISARYRAMDPVFGPIGRVPVTKGAMSLSPSEYSRLALSGAVCTVIVRTLLNPLELVKTKIQLNNDQEVTQYALSKSKMSAFKEEHSEGEPSGGDSTSQESNGAETDVKEAEESIGTIAMMQSLVEIRGIKSLFQSADITFLASLVFGSFGFGATELFRRSFTEAFFSDEGGQAGAEIVLLVAAAVACVVTSAAAAPFEVLRVKSMGLVEAKSWTEVLDLYLEDKKGSARGIAKLRPQDLLPLWSGFAPTVSRELPFAVTKFLVFDTLAREVTDLANAQLGEGAVPVQVGVGTAGLAISAISGAVAGVAGAIVSHPADLLLTLTSTYKSSDQVDWKDVVKDLLSRDGGLANLFVGLPARSVFFFLVIGLQFFLYDYVKNIFQVGSEDLSLVLDVFYAVRQGLVDTAAGA